MTTGEISKTLILKALLHEPQLLVMDEPFNGLDRRSRDMVADFIGSLIRTGLQVIIITHRLDEIIPEISHVLLMTAEGVQKMGYKDEVLNSGGASAGLSNRPRPAESSKSIVRAGTRSDAAFEAGSREPFGGGHQAD